MLDQFNRYISRGLSINEAVIKAGKSRFRAIILTTITTVAGLYPLILEKSFQAQFLIPMAISVAFGVLFGTIIILFYFPVLILYFNDIRRARWWLWRGGEIPPGKLEVEPVIKNLIRTNEFLEIGNTEKANPITNEYSDEIENLKKEILELKEFNAAKNQEDSNNKKF